MSLCVLQARWGVLGRVWLRGGRFGACLGRVEGVLGAPWGRFGGVLETSGAGFPRPRSVKNHVFYEWFWPSRFGAPIHTQVAAQAAFVHSVGALASIS